MASTKHLVIAIIGITLVLVGIALVGFPFASQSLNAKAQTRIGAEYTLIANHESAQRFEQAVAANEAGDYKAALAQLTLNGTDAIAPRRCWRAAVWPMWSRRWWTWLCWPGWGC